MQGAPRSLIFSVAIVALLGLGHIGASEEAEAAGIHGEADAVAAVAATWRAKGLGQPSQDEIAVVKGLMRQAAAESAREGSAAEQELQLQIAAARDKESAAKKSAVACREESSVASEEDTFFELGESEGTAANVTTESLAVVNTEVKSPFAQTPDMAGLQCATAGINCTFDGVGDDCAFKEVESNSSATRDVQYSLCHGFFQAADESTDFAVCQVMETAVSETSNATTQEYTTEFSSTGRRLLSAPLDQQRSGLLSMLEEDSGAYATLGRRGKASTVRRAGAAFTYDMMSFGTSSYQGNFEEDESLGEASSTSSNRTNSTKVGDGAVDLRIQAMGRCATADHDLKKQGPTCVVAYLHNKAINNSYYTLATDNNAAELVALPEGCEAAASANNCTYATTDEEQNELAELCSDYASSA